MNDTLKSNMLYNFGNIYILRVTVGNVKYDEVLLQFQKVDNFQLLKVFNNL